MQTSHHRLGGPGRGGRVAAALVLAAVAAACGGGGPNGPTPLPGATVEPPSAATPPPAPAVPQSVRYRVVFDGLWSRETHPTDYPGNPHFSPLIGGTHAAAVRFWAEGAIASDGIRRMAEQGLTSPLDSEVMAAIAGGTARAVVRGGGIPLSPSSTSVEFEIAQSHPLLTLVSMVAPSPDWFVGVSALPLFVDGQWIDRVEIDLRPWDAGTDGGRSFESADVPLSPRLPIVRLLGPPVATGAEVRPMARFVMTRL